ncbi:MAG: MFS transporter, partial [Candidatus Hodarchaeales archaeon]|jgi:MFS family permease
MKHPLENKNLERTTDKGPLLVLFFAVMLDLMGFGMVFPILPFWTTNIIGTSEFVFGMLLATYSAMTFLFAPIWGRISDQKGRRPIILIGLTLSFVGFAILFLAAVFFIENLALLFVSRMIAGIGAAAVLPTAQAYVSDSTTGKERNKGFALIGAAYGFGFALGPALGSIFTILGEILVPSMKGYWAPALFAVGLTVVNFIAAQKMLPESLPQESHHNDIGGRSEISPLTLIRTEVNLLAIVLLISVFAAVTLSISSLESILVLFGEVRFGLNEAFAGLVLLVFGVVGILTQGGAIKHLAKRFADTFLIALGLMVLLVGFLGLSTILNLEGMIFWIAIVSFGTFVTLPTINAFLSKQVPGEVQGTVLGINQSIAALMRILGPLLATFLFEQGDALPFFAVVAILLAAFAVAVSLTQIAAKVGSFPEGSGPTAVGS